MKKKEKIAQAHKRIKMRYKMNDSSKPVAGRPIKSFTLFSNFIRKRKRSNDETQLY